MPHSMMGSRGMVRFRGKNSPRHRREAAQREREDLLLQMARKAAVEARVAQESLRHERRPVIQKVKDKASGFVRSLFSRKTA